MIPAALQRRLDALLVAVRQHDQHALLPAQRRRIYDHFGPRSNSAAQRRRAQLALSTARHVLPMWQKARPQDNRAERLLALAESVMGGKVDAQAAAREGEHVWYWLFNDYGDRQEELPDPAFLALTAVLRALFCALGQEHFEDVLISKKATDADIDLASSDTASAAADAYAGPVWESQSGRDRRLEFWTWWLTDAIPAAWRNSELD